MLNQTSRVLAHLKECDHLTPLEAIGLYGVYRLAARIFDLRKAGHTIITDVRRDRVGRPYSRYKLVR